MLARLVGRFWRWDLRRHDPDALVPCVNCQTTVRRAELVDLDCCSKACARERADLMSY